MSDTDEVLRASASRRTIEECSLVLTAERISHRVLRTSDGWKLLVPADDVARASCALEEYEREQREKRLAEDALPEAVEYGPTWAAVGIAAALLVFYAVAWSPAWRERGVADAGLIREGEWWRTVTALTLHASGSHVFANSLAFALFGSALCRDLGPGVGLLLILLSGAGGNAVNAFVQSPLHRAIGASTAVFGAVGALTGLQFSRRRRRAKGRRAWLPIVAGLALLGWLGADPESDVLAHLLGFGVGCPLGILASRMKFRPMGPLPQWALVTLVLAIVVLSWTASQA